MKNIVKILGFIAIVAMIGFTFAACDDPDAGLPALTGTVSITGTAQVGQTLTANTGSLGGSGTITYQWNWAGSRNIGGNSNIYTVQADDIGGGITVTVTRSDNSGSVTSGPTATVIGSALPALTGTVSITGTAQVGQTLTANTGSLGGSGTITYQWKRGSTNIGINSSTYVVQTADSGLTITVSVTRSGNSGSVTSNPTATVSALPALTGTVTITGIPQVGQTLIANTVSLGGSGTITYQWRRGTTNIGTNNTYIVQTADAGSTITVTVTRSGNSESVTSDPIVIAFVEMVFVPGGSFELGREIGTVGSGDVTPVSTVTLTGFHIGKYQVTQEEYQAVMGTNPSWFITAKGRPPATGETDARRPVEEVSWYDAIVFCNRLSILEGLTPAYSINGSTNPNDWGTVPTTRNNATWDAVVVVSGSIGYRLPTEAQWEYAAKGGNNPPVGFTFAGSNNANDVAWHIGNSGGRTREVGRLQPNGLGIYDMSGNVKEMCWDWWGGYTSEAKTDPTGAVSGAFRVLRGGSWNNSAGNTRSAYRSADYPGNGDYVNGFRLVRP